METRQRLLACALDELERSGLDRFSLRAVGAEAGLSAMAVYRHFANKDDLLRALGEEAFDVWRRRIESIKEPDFDKWLQKVCRAYIEFSLDEPARFDACFVLKTNVERIYPEDFRAGSSPVIGLTIKRIEAAQREDKLRAGDPLEMALLVWAQLHGLVMLHRSGRFSLKRSDFLALCKRSSELSMHGLRK
jgi:AcrR family transcriptional regulator